MQEKVTLVNSSQYPDGLGEILIKGREAANLSQAEIVQRLRLPVEYIQAMESNTIDSIPRNQITVYGYIRSYARVVGLNEWDIMDKLEKHHAAQQKIAKQDDKPRILTARFFNAQTLLSIKNKKFRWITYAIVLLFLILVMISWHNSGDKTTTDTVPPAATTTSNTGDSVVQQEATPLEPEMAKSAPESPKADIKPEHKPESKPVRVEPAQPAFHMDIGG